MARGATDAWPGFFRTIAAVATVAALALLAGFPLGCTPQPARLPVAPTPAAPRPDPGDALLREPLLDPDAEPAFVVVMTEGRAFSPREVHIRPGRTVIWWNRSGRTHTATFDPDRASNPDAVELPVDVQPFDSSDVEPGERFAHTFETPGLYRYVCVHHEGADMRGAVIVAD